MLQKARFLVGAVLVVLTSAAVSYAVSAAVPDSLRPAGSTRYAVAQSTAATSDNSGDAGFENMADMATSISIPAGKKGDVMVVYCGETVTGDASTIRVRAMAGGSLLGPPNVPMDTVTTAGMDCATFYKLNVPDGTRTVRMQWHAYTSATIWSRTMIVTVNIHD